jgi:hypothetical protein
MQLWLFITYFAVVNLTNPLLMIRGSGGIQLFLYLGELVGGSMEAAKFMDKREAQFIHDDEKVLRKVFIIGNLELDGVGGVLQ